MQDSSQHVASNNQAFSGDMLAKTTLTHGQKSWIKRHRSVLIVLSVLVILVASSGVALGVYTWDRGVMANGISISDVQVGNLSLAAARTKINAKAQSILDKKVKFSVDNNAVELSQAQLGLQLQTEAALTKAYAVGRQGNIAERALAIRDAGKGINYPLPIKWDDKKLIATLNKTFSTYNIAPVDASFTINMSNNTMDIKPDRTGRSADISSLAAQVKQLDIFNPGQLQVKLNQANPKVTTAQLESQKITGLIASYTTEFNASEVNRSVNVRVAAQAFDDKVVKPGETFSFNNTTGERTAAKGYKNAIIIENGEFVPGLAGGVCQVSSTLYNALLMADLPITERANHSLEISYVPMGQDATVAYPVLDLKFKNDTGAYILIRSKVTNNTLTFYLYGKVNSGQQVDITTHLDSTVPPKQQRVVDNSLPHGAVVVRQAGQPGYVVTTYRTVKENGQIVKTEDLGKSVYEASPEIVAVGP